jgi:hypothetical protein
MNIGIVAVVVLTGCGEPAFENAGSQRSLIEDREACIAEIDNSPEANAYRQNPDNHPEYPGTVFHELNRCIERRGWKLVRSQQEEERLHEAIAKEAGQKDRTPSALNSKTSESVVHEVERRLGGSFSYQQRHIKSD